MNLYFSRNVNSYSMIDVTAAIKGYFDDVDSGKSPILAKYRSEHFSVFATASRNEAANAVFDLFIVADDDQANDDGVIEFFRFDREFLQKLISSYTTPIKLPLSRNDQLH
jgi:hypothetical protein